MDIASWHAALREQPHYQQAQAVLKAIAEHQHAIVRLESFLESLGEIAELARQDRQARLAPASISTAECLSNPQYKSGH